MITLKNKFLTCRISEVGAEIQSITDSNGKEYIWQGLAPFWTSHAINLFPVCGRMFEQKYLYNGKEYSLCNHGFTRKSTFECVESSDFEATFRLISSEETKSQYPFDFVFDIVYKLKDTKLTCDFVVRNTGKEEMVFACGAHPGFNTDNIEDFYVDFGEKKPSERVFSEACLDIGKTRDFPLREGRYLDLKHSLFDIDAIFFQNVGENVSLVNRKGGKIVISCKAANFWGIWHTPRSQAPYVCIEPWYGIPGKDGAVENIDEREYMVHLEPNGKYVYEYGIEIE